MSPTLKKYQKSLRYFFPKSRTGYDRKLSAQKSISICTSWAVARFRKVILYFSRSAYRPAAGGTPAGKHEPVVIPITICRCGTFISLYMQFDLLFTVFEDISHWFSPSFSASLPVHLFTDLPGKYLYNSHSSSAKEHIPWSSPARSRA